MQISYREHCRHHSNDDVAKLTWHFFHNPPPPPTQPYFALEWKLVLLVIREQSLSSHCQRHRQRTWGEYWIVFDVFLYIIVKFDEGITNWQASPRCNIPLKVSHFDKRCFSPFLATRRQKSTRNTHFQNTDIKVQLLTSFTRSIDISFLESNTFM